jgi:hypothetical protein
MTQPFSGMPNPSGMPKPEIPRPFKRRSQPAVVQEAVQKVLRAARDRARPLLQSVRRGGRDALGLAQRHTQNLWQRGRRNPRTVGLIAGAVALMLGGAYALNASSAGRSLCPPSSKPARFLLLMDPVPQVAAGSEMNVHYDVCGLRSGTPYRGKVRLSQHRPGGKKRKNSVTPKPLVVTFQDKADGPASRRLQEVNLGPTKPGAYMLELIVVDNMGRERKRLQKIQIKRQ